jgi:hypothetical protein
VTLLGSTAVVLRRVTAVVAFAVALGGLVGCAEARSSLRPSSSLADVEFTIRPTKTPSASASASVEPTEAPTFVSLPVGWDDAFCAVFSDAVIAQELIIDIERALEEANVRDARGLARDLRDTAADATELLADLPVWEPATAATAAIASLIDLDGRAGAEYGTYFTDGTALRRARTLRRQVLAETPQANETLAELAALGITCGDLQLQLELLPDA